MILVDTNTDTPSTSFFEVDLKVDIQGKHGRSYELVLPLESNLRTESFQLHIAEMQPPSLVSAEVSGVHRQLTITFPQNQTGQSLPEATGLSQPQEARVINPLRKSIKHHHLFTDRTMPLVNILWNIVLSQALQTGLRVSGMVDVEEDAEESTNQVVLRVYVQASAVQTLAFWDGLDNDVGRWLDHLDTTRREIVTDKIGLRLHWSN